MVVGSSRAMAIRRINNRISLRRITIPRAGMISTHRRLHNTSSSNTASIAATPLRRTSPSRSTNKAGTGDSRIAVMASPLTARSRTAGLRRTNSIRPIPPRIIKVVMEGSKAEATTRSLDKALAGDHVSVMPLMSSFATM